MNPISGPIELKEKNWKILNIHSTIDSTFIDITKNTHCKPISNSSLKCPYDGEYIGRKDLIKNTNWNVILSMMSWQKLINIPINFWRGEDWRLITSDKSLNKISDWNYPPNKYGNNCRPVYQTTRCQLLARLLKGAINRKKEYFGQSESDQHPLLDMTPQLAINNVRLSNRNIEIFRHENVIVVHANRVGTTDLAVINSQNNKVAFDLIRVEDESVFIVDIDVSCFTNLNIHQMKNSRNLLFQTLIVHMQQSQGPKESCYFRLRLIFSDGTDADLMDYKHTNFQLDLVHIEMTEIVFNPDTFLYEPSKYKQPGRFVLQLSESPNCQKNKLLFKKQVDLYKIRPTQEISSTKSLDNPSETESTGPTTMSSIVTTTFSKGIISKVTTSKTIDTETLFLSMKILIGLVLLVVLIIILNCIIKIRHRKSACLLDRQLNNCQIYGQVDKLMSSTYSPADITSQNSNNQHPPLLPPPGPLYNSSDSSQINLAVNATPDMFWNIAHPGENIDRNINSHVLMGMQMHSFNGPGNNIMFPSSRRTSPSPHSDSLEYNCMNSNGTKSSLSKTAQSVPGAYNYPSGSLQDSDSLASGSGSKTSSQVAVIVPPCPPLRWKNNWSSNQFPVYFPNDKDVTAEPSISQLSNAHSSQNSLTPSHSSSWEIKHPLILPPIGFNSNENVCEKSSGVGSLSSTQPGSECSKKDSTHTSSPRITNFSTSH